MVIFIILKLVIVNIIFSISVVFFMEISVSDLLERIKTIVPLKELNKLGFATSTISGWKIRNVFPQSDDLYRIAKYLNVTMEWLLTGENPNTEIPEDIQKSVKKMLTLTDKQREPINVLIDGQVNYWKTIDR